MMQWINIEQVTIEKIHEKGGLWVVELGGTGFATPSQTFQLLHKTVCLL